MFWTFYIIYSILYKMENNEPTEESPYIINPEIDKITLELFMNKKKYKKYVEKTDPKRYSELQIYYAELQKYRGTILNMTDDLLENPDMQITSEISELFETYTRSIIHYLKNKELEKMCEHEALYRQEDSDDIMFGKMDESELVAHSSNMKSFWGNEQVVKTQSRFSKKDISRFGVI